MSVQLRVRCKGWADVQLRVYVDADADVSCELTAPGV